MGVLKNKRHEAFACAMAKEGMTLEKAMEAAGYKPDRSNARRLTANDHTKRRIAEIQAMKSTAALLSRTDVLRELAENAGLARRAQQYSASNQALINYGKELGMFVDRRLVGVHRVEDMSEEEILEFLGGEPSPGTVEEFGAGAGSPPSGHA